MKIITRGVVAAATFVSIASTSILPAFADPANPTQNETTSVEKSDNFASINNGSLATDTTNTPNTDASVDGASASVVNNTGLLVTIAVLSVLLTAYSLTKMIKR